MILLYQSSKWFSPGKTFTILTERKKTSMQSALSRNSLPAGTVESTFSTLPPEPSVASMTGQICKLLLNCHNGNPILYYSVSFVSTVSGFMLWISQNGSCSAWQYKPISLLFFILTDYHTENRRLWCRTALITIRKELRTPKRPYSLVTKETIEDGDCHFESGCGWHNLTIYLSTVGIPY